MTRSNITYMLLFLFVVGSGCDNEGTEPHYNTEQLNKLEKFNKADFAEYRVNARTSYEIDLQGWNEKKEELSTLESNQMKCLLLFAIARCNENNELLEEDYFKVFSVQRLLLADLASKAGWPEMAWNLQTESFIGAEIVRSGYAEKIEADAKVLARHRLKLISVAKISDSDITYAYSKHEALFDETASVIIALPKFAVWGRQRHSEE